MSGSVNKVILVGNLGRDPELHSFQNGGKVANLSLATSERWTDKQSGQARERTEWHRVSVYAEPLIEIIERFMKKGSKVYLEGQLETRKYTDQSGAEKFTTEVVLRPFRSQLQLLDPPPTGTAGRDGDHPGQAPEGYARAQQARPGTGRQATPTGGRRAPPPIDDDIPF